MTFIKSGGRITDLIAAIAKVGPDCEIGTKGEAINLASTPSDNRTGVLGIYGVFATDWQDS
jgi:hypothetical protein